MPTYEYQCDGCSHNFDEFQSINDKPLKKCPACGKHRLRRVFGAGAAIIFKGSGFYQTDYRSESYKQAAKADQEGGKPAGDKADSTVPAAKDTKTGTTAPSTNNGAKGAAKSPKSKT